MKIIGSFVTFQLFRLLEEAIESPPGEDKDVFTKADDDLPQCHVDRCRKCLMKCAFWLVVYDDWFYLSWQGSKSLQSRHTYLFIVCSGHLFLQETRSQRQEKWFPPQLIFTKITYINIFVHYVDTSSCNIHIASFFNQCTTKQTHPQHHFFQWNHLCFFGGLA